MNKTVVLALIGAFFAALVVAMIVSAQVSTSDQTPEKEAVKTVEILVSDQDMPIGTKLSQANTRWQAWPEKALFADAYVKGVDDTDDLLNKKTRRPLYKDEPVTRNAVIVETTGGYMAAALEEGMRAVAVKVDAPSSAGGFITPGDMVDVIMVYQIRARSQNPEETQKKVVRDAAETVLENVRVLAVDQDSDSLDDEAKLGKTITLEVTTQGAEVIALAQKMGDIYLSLRQLGEDKTVHSQGTTDVGIGNTLQSVVNMSKGRGYKNKVRVYNGSQVEEMAVRPVGQAAPADDSKPASSARQENEEMMP
jgi:pilus assembly protein CpaB